MAGERLELKKMVASFHIPELQILLGLLKLNKYGRKAELLQRAQAALSRGVSRHIQEEIRELYRRKFSVRQYVPNEVDGMLKPPALLPPTPMYYSGNMYGMMPGNSGSGSSSMSVPADRLLPVHPDVELKPLPFYDIHAELLKPSTLMSRGVSGVQEAFFSFHLTPLQSQDISMSRDVHVQLRFCLLETSCAQQDKFPSGIGVRINGKPAQLPTPIPTNKLGVEPKRPGLPVSITPQCHLSAAVPNHIQVAWSPEIGQSFCVAVYLVKQLNSDILLQRLKQNGIRHPYHTRALVKEKLALDVDSEIATTSLRISLLCPLGKVRMRIPCRASTCSHLQCFDASTFLQMNEKKPTWLCPICDKPAEFSRLAIDGLFTEILNTEVDGTEIQFTEDGNWRGVNGDTTECCIPDSPPAKMAKTNLTPTESDSSVGVAGTVFGETIDLTATDDEDDDDEIDMENKSLWPPSFDCTTSLSNRFGYNSATLSLADSCEPFPQLYLSSSPRDSSSPSVITIDTPPPPAHSPYSSPRAAVSSMSDSRPPPAHTHSNSLSVGRSSLDRSWVVCRPQTASPSMSDDFVPLSLTLRRCPVPESALSSISLSSSSSSSPCESS